MTLIDAQTICATAGDLVAGDRQLDYGDKLDNHENIARLWNAYLCCVAPQRNNGSLTARDVAMMMALLKIARTALGRPTIDTYVDMAGYAGIAGEIAQRETDR